jgi:hypothetical protein
MAVLAALASKPAVLHDRFYTKEVNQAGIYLVSFYINNILHPVIIDGYVPMKYGKPYFTSGRENELWVILMEKAWAKLCGSYAKQAIGYVNYAFTHVSGVPNFEFPHSELQDFKHSEHLWKRLNAALSNHFSIVASTKI